MKNQKGFTLVELLAVIAILAILVIMALPAVLRMFNQARIDTFSNEVNTILRTVRQQYLLDGGNAQTWTNADGSTNKLPLTGNSKLKYYVSIDGNGKITELQATNGEYQYSKSGIIEEVIKNDIKVVSELSEEDKLVIDGSGSGSSTPYVYYSGDTGVLVGASINGLSGVYDNYQDAINAFGHNSFIRFTVENDIITETYNGFIKNGNVYYLKGYDTSERQNNISIVKDAFGSSNCTENSSYTNCTSSEISTYVLSSGAVTIYGDGWQCGIGDNSNSRCW